MADPDEALIEAIAAVIDPDAWDDSVPLWQLPGSDREGCKEYARRQARAVVAVADEERAALVELVREMGREAVTEAEAYRAVLARAEAAEAKVAKVEALADEHDHCSGCPSPWWLRAVLADAPAEQTRVGVRMCACGHIKESHDASGECFACAGPPCDGGSDQ